MRKPEYISFSAYTQWSKDLREFYLRYLSDNRPPYLPQSLPAAIGSGFDAHAKAALHAAIFGPGSDPAYTLEALYETQVEPQNRDDAREASQHCFNSYQTSEFYGELLAELEQADGEPRFETTLRQDINGVVILGKPDLYYRRKNGLRVVHDWKVNGYCSKSNTSPNKGYRLCRDGWREGRQSASHDKAHKSYKPLAFEGYDIDEGFMEDYNIPWAEQLSMYGWCLGEEVGSELFVIQIHQLTAKPADDFPLIRVAEFRSRVRKSFQDWLHSDLLLCWNAIQSGHIFPELPREENDERCQLLDAMSATLEADDFFSTAIRPEFKGY